MAGTEVPGYGQANLPILGRPMASPSRRSRLLAGTVSTFEVLVFGQLVKDVRTPVVNRELPSNEFLYVGELDRG